MRRCKWCVLGLAMCLILPGCAMMHEFRPHRMWRWNRGPAPSTNPFFSVTDPIPQLGQPGKFPEPVDAAADAAGMESTLQ